MVDDIVFPKLANVLVDAESDSFCISVFEMSEERVKVEKLNRIWDAVAYGEVQGLEAGKYVRLVDKNKREVVMSDTWMEKVTNQEFVHKANGDVLIAGLGLGLIVLAIQDKLDVKSVLIVEKEKDVIDLLSKQIKFNDKVKIVQGDIFSYVPVGKFDTIYFDIWNNISGDNYVEMKKLHLCYRKFLNKDNPACFLESWRRDRCRKLNKGLI